MTEILIAKNGRSGGTGHANKRQLDSLISFAQYCENKRDFKRAAHYYQKALDTHRINDMEERAKIAQRIERLNGTR